MFREASKTSRRQKILVENGFADVPNGRATKGIIISVIPTSGWRVGPPAGTSITNIVTQMPGDEVAGPQESP
jgi:hypothetical protein